MTQRMSQITDPTYDPTHLSNAWANAKESTDTNVHTEFPSLVQQSAIEHWLRSEVSDPSGSKHDAMGQTAKDWAYLLGVGVWWCLRGCITNQIIENWHWIPKNRHLNNFITHIWMEMLWNIGPNTCYCAFCVSTRRRLSSEYVFRWLVEVGKHSYSAVLW